jgi:hypothetical protein
VAAQPNEEVELWFSVAGNLIAPFAARFVEFCESILCSMIIGSFLAGTYMNAY